MYVPSGQQESASSLACRLSWKLTEQDIFCSQQLQEARKTREPSRASFACCLGTSAGTEAALVVRIGGHGCDGQHAMVKACNGNDGGSAGANACVHGGGDDGDANHDDDNTVILMRLVVGVVMHALLS